MLSFLQILSSIILSILSAAVFYHFVILRAGPNEPPLVKGSIPFLGCALSLNNDFKSFLLENRAKYGSIFTIYVAGQRIHIFSDPVNGIPTYFRNKNFDFKDFANLIRKKQFLNTSEEVADDSMSEQLYAALPSTLLSNELTEKLVAQTQTTLQALVDDTGHEWKEVDLIGWCFKLVFLLSNVAMMGPTFPRDDELYRDL